MRLAIVANQDNLASVLVEHLLGKPFHEFLFISFKFRAIDFTEKILSLLEMM